MAVPSPDDDAAALGRAGDKCFDRYRTVALPPLPMPLLPLLLLLLLLLLLEEDEDEAPPPRRAAMAVFENVPALLLLLLLPLPAAALPCCRSRSDS
jgi:hypothetical protein